MSVEAQMRLTAPAADIAIETGFGWRCHRAGDVTLWFKGWIAGADGQALASKLAAATPTADAIGAYLAQLDGHFAFAATGNGWALAAVDWVRSIPLAAARVQARWTLDDRPDRLRRRLGLGTADIDSDAALSTAMAGYTIDNAALYRGLEVLAPGELMYFGRDGSALRHRYYVYRPWRVEGMDPAKAERDLAEITLAIMQRTLASLGGRPLVVPLSAGLDSRLVASAARHLGYKNVRCYSYGRAGNFEAVASRAIAERLGYAWRFVPATIPTQRRYFASESYRNYLDFADSCASVPFVQDMAPLQTLQAEGFVAPESVIANGNTGDYISGMHIPSPLQSVPAGLHPELRKQRILTALSYKHFALWQSLRTPANVARIETLLWQSIESVGGTLGDPETDHGLYEYAEFQDRQCKYVITGQRIYEFLGHEWRLPLWDNAYLRFWESIPLELKSKQTLYANMLATANWGDVWRNIPLNVRTVRPRWIVPLRWIARAGHAPFGRARWHRFERRYLQYWMDNTCNSACIPFRLAAIDRRGARHAVAWLAALYLERKCVTLDRFEV